MRSSEWFGPIPEGWEMKPLKALFTFSKGLGITKADLTEEGAPVVSYGQIHSKTYKGTGIDESIVRYVSEQTVADNVTSQVDAGGFIFADTSEDLDGVGNCAYNASMEGLYGGYHTVVLNPRESADNKYLAYLFRTDAWRKQLRRQLVDVKLFSITQSILSETYVVLPPLKTRKAIVAYLDARCAQIDEAVARHRATIGKLEEYRRAVITKAVTKGLDPNADMKDSGYEWIGTIPRHWTVMKLSFFSSSVLGKMLDQRQETHVNVHRYLANKDVQWFSINTEHLFSTSFPMNSDHRYGLQRGDILICEGGEVGRCAIWQEDNSDVYFQKALHRLRVRHDIAVPEFIAYQIYQKAFANKFIEVRKGEATISHLPGDQLKQLKFVLPSLDEQMDIVTYLDYQCAAVDDAIDRQTQIISKLEEYRKSLIHAAVTGRIDCTEGAEE